MKTVISLLAATMASLSCFGQCANGFNKLFPEKSEDYSLDFGNSISMYDNYLAVGVPDSDTVGRQSGIVYIYEKRNDAWAKIASIVAFQPVPDLRFGISVNLSEHHLLVSAEAGGGQVFIFEKPVSGWQSVAGTNTLSLPGTAAFGVAYSHPVDISADGNTIVVADAWKDHGSNSGSLFVFHKNTATPWSNAIIPVEIKATTDVVDLGRAGVYLSGTYIITGTPYTASGRGNVFIYNDPSGNFTNPTLQALLTPPPNTITWTNNLVVLDDGVMWSGIDGQQRLMYFEKPADGHWVDAGPTYILDPDQFTILPNVDFIQLATNGIDVFAASPNYYGGTYLTCLKKNGSDWATPTRQTLDIKYNNQYGLVLAANQQGDVVAGHVPHPNNSAVSNALICYIKTPADTWSVSTLYAVTENTRMHAYGTRMVMKDDFLFVSAIGDNTLKAEAGKVYIYRKDGSQWDKMSVIIPNATPYVRPHLGTAMAASDNFVAVGSTSWGPLGRFFVYKKTADDWTATQFIQEIEIPNPQNTIQAYGDNVAMTDRWLLIPYGEQNSGLDTKIAVYENNGTSWDLKQTVSAGYFNFFSRYTTVGIAIEGDVFVAHHKVYELDASGTWINTADLRPGDPEDVRFNSSFQMIQNGSYFGQTVAIKNNTIFVGAPRKDDAYGTWDVGAVYVYGNTPGAKWASRSESVKLMPAASQHTGMFGTSIFPTDNAVMVGAPVDAYYAGNVFGSPVAANVPGRATLFKAGNPLWTSAFVVKVFNGDMKVRDNFGIQVGMDDKHVLIASSLDDIPTGRTAGTVYIADIPVTVDPAPVLCSDSKSIITLTASPAGGSWSGQGVVNATLGKFDTHAAGVGTHQVTYTIPGCSGTVDVKVVANPPATFTVAETYTVCKEASLSIPLKVNPVNSYNYQWQFRPDAGSPFTPVGQNSPDFNASKRGEYQVNVYGQYCETLSDIIDIKNESIDVHVDAQVSTCGTPSEGLILNATPAGGTWSGAGVTNNRFFLGTLIDGNYPLSYQYTSALGCNYKGQTVVQVEHLRVPTIGRSGNLCENESVTLALKDAALSGATYTWSKKETGENIYSGLETGISLETTKRGSYMLTLEKEYCRTTSTPIDINDQFSMALTPADEKSETCHDSDFFFTLPPDPSAIYTWSYSADGEHHVLLTASNNSIHPTKTGYYHAEVKKGLCAFTSPTKYILVHAEDSIFVPNIFTPNGDGKNDTFQILIVSQDNDAIINQHPAAYAIYNRYGGEVFASPDNQPWTGDDISTGVYFWSGTYHTCTGDPKVIKGLVHLVK